jgi:hypothetical protein
MTVFEENAINMNIIKIDENSLCMIYFLLSAVDKSGAEPRDNCRAGYQFVLEGSGVINIIFYIVPEKHK